MAGFRWKLDFRLQGEVRDLALTLRGTALWNSIVMLQRSHRSMFRFLEYNSQTSGGFGKTKVVSGRVDKVGHCI